MAAPAVQATAERVPETLAPRKNRLVYENLFAARVAPAGLVDRLALSYRRQLVPRSSPLWQESQASIKFDTTVTPAYATLGPAVAIQPLTVFRLTANYQWVGYFGTFGNLQSYSSPLADHSASARKQAAEAELNYVTTGHLVNLTSMLQGKVGSAVVRAELTMRWMAMSLRDGDRVHFDQYMDTLVPDYGFTALLDADALWELRFGLLAGARYSLVAPIFQAKHFDPGDDLSGAPPPISRLGPAAIYQFFSRPGARFNEPSAFAIVQWHLSHPYRTGAEVSAGVPTVIIGMMFRGDLIGSTSRSR